MQHAMSYTCANQNLLYVLGLKGSNKFSLPLCYFCLFIAISAYNIELQVTLL